MSIDYDLFVIDPNNKDTTSEQFRDCVFDALQNLNNKVEALKKLLDKNNNL